MRTLVFFCLFLPVTLVMKPAHTAEQPVETASPAAAETVVDNPARAKVLAKWLHLLDTEKGDSSDGQSVLSYAPQVPDDLARIMGSTGEAGRVGFVGVLIRSLLAVVLGWVAVRALLIFYRKKIEKFTASLSESGSANMFGTQLLMSLPGIISLLVFAIAATLVFLFVAGGIGIKGRMFFQALLGTVVIFYGCALLGRILFSPENENLRLFAMDTSLARPLYRTFYVSVGFLLSGLLIVRLFQELGASRQSVSWVGIVLGSTVIMLYAYLVYSLRRPVADALLRQLDEHHDESLVKRQLSMRWHGLSLVYLSLVWFFWVGQQLTGTGAQKGSFIASMLIVPLFFLLSYCGRLLIGNAVDALNLGYISDDEFGDHTDEETKAAEREKKKLGIESTSYRVFKILLTLILLTWFLSLWGFKIPYAAEALQAVFESLVVLTLALLGWRATDRYISRKLEESEPEIIEDQDLDDEFGGAVARGRSHTLLPMLRKVVGTILVVMVMLVTLSAFGVNIAPLLAGAGVVGLAIGFGAQKLVSDVLSGFFFLLDDAFRVGEYVQAGSIKGTVEAITLRNVMLRHHLGMLQVVPHSDLGAITNYMRGGIVIKFPLEFPYDTDIDKVRKVIKKVGIAMLDDPELGDDFLLPVKSQGVHQITNSVMVIRVKFTAKPGKQFVIKREAFRRITEALNAKGIYYAHRKVIVDFPEETKINPQGPEALKAIEAGAAAAIAAEDAQQQQQKKDQQP